jgi:hypothetical protein
VKLIRCFLPTFRIIRLKSIRKILQIPVARLPRNKNSSNNFFVAPVALIYRNKVPAPFRHPVDVFLPYFLLSGNILPDIVDS